MLKIELSHINSSALFMQRNMRERNSPEWVETVFEYKISNKGDLNLRETWGENQTAHVTRKILHGIETNVCILCEHMTKDILSLRLKLRRNARGNKLVLHSPEQ